MSNTFVLKSSIVALSLSAVLLSGCHSWSRPAYPKGDAVRVESTVASVNYTPRGEIDGFVLNNGEFVHFGPRQNEAIKLAVGTKVTVGGIRHYSPSGVPVIEAREINGQQIIMR